MRTKINQLTSSEEAKEYNKKNIESQMKYRCCISTAACLNCFSVISDSICICAGIGVCPECKFDNSFKFEINEDGNNYFLDLVVDKSK